VLTAVAIRDHPASEVYVTGTFDDWSKSEKLVKSGDSFVKDVTLPSAEEKIYYKVRGGEDQLRSLACGILDSIYAVQLCKESCFQAAKWLLTGACSAGDVLPGHASRLVLSNAMLRMLLSHAYSTLALRAQLEGPCRTSVGAVSLSEL
jgi:hypothetical protein